MIAANSKVKQIFFSYPIPAKKRLSKKIMPLCTGLHNRLRNYEKLFFKLLFCINYCT